MLVASIALYAVGWALGWPVLIAVAVAGLLALALGTLWLVRRPDLTVDRRLDQVRVARGDDVTVRLTLDNRSRWTSPRLLADDTVGRQRIAVSIPRLRPHQRDTVTVTFPAARRGVFTVGPLRLVSSDPFGLLRRERPHGATDTLWVHPVVQPLALMPTERSPSLEGPMADTAPSGSITFHALREYVLGDDLRKIHWRSTARLGTLMVREHVDTSQPATTVVLDTNRTAHDPDGFEHAVDVAASVLANVALHGFPARFLTTGDLELGDGTKVLPPTAFLDALAAVERSDGRSLAALTDRLGRQRNIGTLVVVTGRADPVLQGRVAGLRSRFERVVLAMVDPESDEEIAQRAPRVVELRAAEAISFADAWSRVRFR